MTLTKKWIDAQKAEYDAGQEVFDLLANKFGEYISDIELECGKSELSIHITEPYMFSNDDFEFIIKGKDLDFSSVVIQYRSITTQRAWLDNYGQVQYETQKVFLDYITRSGQIDKVATKVEF